MNNFNDKKRFLFFPFVALAFLLIGGYVVMFLWNYIFPVAIKSVGYLTYWQGVALLVLSKILFSSFRGFPRNNKLMEERFKKRQEWKEKFMTMTPEQKENFKEMWKERCRKK